MWGRLMVLSMLLTGCREICGYEDRDEDGFGVGEQLEGNCDSLDFPTADVSGDCDDTRADVRPGAEEICGDDIVQDCNAIDESTACPDTVDTGPNPSPCDDPKNVPGVFETSTFGNACFQ